jgi:hypothetical protein
MNAAPDLSPMVAAMLATRTGTDEHSRTSKRSTEELKQPIWNQTLRVVGTKGAVEATR